MPTGKYQAVRGDSRPGTSPSFIVQSDPATGSGRPIRSDSARRNSRSNATVPRHDYAAREAERDLLPTSAKLGASTRQADVIP